MQQALAPASAKVRPARGSGRADFWLSRRGMAILSAVTSAVFWELFGRSGLALNFPPFSDVVVAWIDIMRTGALAKQLPTSFQSLGIGYPMAIVFGIPLGAAMGRFGAIDRLLSPYINGLMAAPTIAFVPILVVWFGATSMWPRVLVVFLFSFYVIVINTATGVKGADPRLVEMARSFGANDWRLFKCVLVPAALPMMFAGLRLGTARAFKGMVMAELLVVITGIGGMLELYGASFMTDYLFAMILSVFFMAYLANLAVETLERRLIGWRVEAIGVKARQARAGAGGEK